MSSKREQFNSIDLMKFIACLFVVAIHANPFGAFPTAGIILQNSISRIFLMFFFTSAGYLFFHRVAEAGMNVRAADSIFRRYITRLIRLWLIWTVLFLPFFLLLHLDELHGFQFSTILTWLHEILCVGSFYHLWFIGALLVGTAVVYGLFRLGVPPVACVGLSAALYLLGLLGHSYAFLLNGFPALRLAKDVCLNLFITTRNGVFCAPIFLSLGWLTASMKRLPPKKVLCPLLAAAVVALTDEVLWLAARTGKRDLMVLLPVASLLLLWTTLQFNILDSPVWPRLRRYSTLIYFLHPLMILFYRIVGGYLGIASWYLFRYCFTAASTLAVAAVLDGLRQRRAFQWLRFLY